MKFEDNRISLLAPYCHTKQCFDTCVGNLYCCTFHFSGQIKTLLDHQEKLLERQTELKTLLEEYEASEKAVDDKTSVTRNDWSVDFEWDSRAEDIRFNVFGIPSYRTNQREVSIAQ